MPKKQNKDELISSKYIEPLDEKQLEGKQYISWRDAVNYLSQYYLTKPRLINGVDILNTSDEVFQVEEYYQENERYLFKLLSSGKVKSIGRLSKVYYGNPTVVTIKREFYRLWNVNEYLNDHGKAINLLRDDCENITKISLYSKELNKFKKDLEASYSSSFEEERIMKQLYNAIVFDNGNQFSRHDILIDFESLKELEPQPDNSYSLHTKKGNEKEKRYEVLKVIVPYLIMELDKIEPDKHTQIKVLHYIVDEYANNSETMRDDWIKNFIKELKKLSARYKSS